jgi:Carboxypeptidase activation peptide
MNRSGYLLAVCWAMAAFGAVHAQEVDEVSYEDFKLLRVAVTNKEQHAHVLRLAERLNGVQVWATHNHSTQIDLLSAPQILDQVRASLDTEGVFYAVIIENLQVSQQMPALRFASTQFVICKVYNIMLFFSFLLQ